MTEIINPTLYKDETGELFLETNAQLGYIIHCYSYKWDKETYKHYKKVWGFLIELLKEKGFSEIYAARLESDEKLKKFAERFGFVDTDLVVADSNFDIRRIMRCRIS